jgi:hypothetical protein
MSENGSIHSGEGTRQSSNSAMCDVDLNSLQPFDTILLRTRNSDYRMLLLDPNAGRALVEGGQYLTEPNQAFIKGSSISETAFKSAWICIGGRLELWVGDRAFITSPVISVHVIHNAVTESVQSISEALH